VEFFLQDHILSTAGDALTLKELKLDCDKWIRSREASLSENILYHASCEAAGYMIISLVHKIECGFARLGPEMYVCMYVVKG
jgi:hypothetical protein